MSLADYNKKVKELIAAIKTGDSDAIRRARTYLPNTAYFSLKMVRAVVAREAGFAGWPELRRACAGDK